MRGRPVSMHAMRGISAHSNGFQTCRALHLLQILLGSDRCAGRLALQVAVIRSLRRRAASPRAARPGRRRPAAAGAALGFPTGPEDLLVEADGSPGRIDKAFSWEAPIAAHGMMHMVIANAAHGDPVPDRHAAPVHGQHGVELGDERRRDDRDATAKDAAIGEYRIPRIIYSDAYSRKWWPMPI